MHDPLEAGLSFLEQDLWTNLLSVETDVGLRAELSDRGPIMNKAQVAVLYASEISLKDKRGF